MPRFGNWTFTVDRTATAKAYAQRVGYRCDCAWCRNFRLARDRVIPDAFVDFLRRLGVDPQMEAEVYELGRGEDGRHLYGGWFHFVGRLETIGDFPPVEFGPGFSAFLVSAHAPGLPSLAGAQVVQLEFTCDSVPWLLAEPDPGQPCRG